MNELILGIDGGGSKTIVVQADRFGNVLDARHGRHCIAAPLAFLNEHRIDQIMRCERMLAHQVSCEVVAPKPARPAGREGGGGKRHHQNCARSVRFGVFVTEETVCRETKLKMNT